VPVLAKIRALSRFEIVKLVRDREMDAGTVARQFKMTRPAVSQHLSMLREVGLVDERRVDRSACMWCARKPSMSLFSSSKVLGFSIATI
jgi:DNA-binding transcriptional ArsR family regulator